MTMHLSELLKRYLHLEPKDRIARTALVQAIQEILSIEISPRAVQPNDGNVFISTHPILKESLLLKKDEICARANEIAGKLVIRSIR